MIQLNIIDYIDKIQPINKKDGEVLTRQGVLWRIKHQLHLPDVKRIDKIGKQYVITINE